MVLVAAFVALYPYADEGGFGGSSGCPDALQAPHAASHLPGVSAVAVLAAVPTVGTFAGFRARRPPDPLGFVPGVRIAPRKIFVVLQDGVLRGLTAFS